MIDPKKRAADMAVVPTALKRPRTELVAAAQSQQLVAMVRYPLKYKSSLLPERYFHRNVRVMLLFAKKNSIEF